MSAHDSATSILWTQRITCLPTSSPLQVWKSCEKMNILMKSIKKCARLISSKCSSFHNFFTPAVFVNHKQFNRIMKRRKAREILASRFGDEENTNFNPNSIIWMEKWTFWWKKSKTAPFGRIFRFFSSKCSLFHPPTRFAEARHTTYMYENKHKYAHNWFESIQRWNMNGFCLVYHADSAIARFSKSSSRVCNSTISMNEGGKNYYFSLFLWKLMNNILYNRFASGRKRDMHGRFIKKAEELVAIKNEPA